MARDLVTVVPLRSPGSGKTRLSVGLDRDERAALAGAMLADVLTALRTASLGPIVVAAGGPGAAAAAAALRADVVMDPPDVRSLDAAIAHAVGTHRAGDVLVVQADLPCLDPADLAAVVAAPTPVVVAPTDDGGTGALLRRPGAVMGTAFGRGSGQAHLALATRAGVAATRVDRPGLAHDVDVWPDLAALRGRDVGPATAAFLDRIVERLDPSA